MPEYLANSAPDVRVVLSVRWPVVTARPWHRLALGRRLVEMHGGVIDVRSEGLGRGSEFIIRMPLSTRPPHEPSTEAVGPQDVDCRVVVIDDHRDAAELMTMLVQELGGECRAAYDGKSGLQEVLTHRPDVALLDIGMPGHHGRDEGSRQILNTSNRAPVGIRGPTSPPEDPGRPESNR